MLGLSKNPKLKKLEIKAYTTKDRAGDLLGGCSPGKTFTVMFNPASFSMKHENVFQGKQGINTSGASANYSHTRSDTLCLDLIMDGTGVGDDLGWKAAGVGLFDKKDRNDVPDKIKKFLDTCLHMYGETHQPRFLTIQWGDGILSSFDCRLQSVDIKHTAFDRNGATLRAELSTVFIEDIAPKKRAKLDNKSSPDLTHTRLVRNGDTLPLLCKEIYGSAAHYPRVAAVNGLDGFRGLRPGQQIFFPPLGK
uniref:Contractile injection system tube protein N-terminal domain-containing protein n=1 Tax=Candidatus Kentrum sp. DK TaxID=2126562 RepID=A0A450RVC7_9GAMM|nr:MAG: hypothetical protein BECKDK2373B_GA0170837_100418 [Candidatus Kentron sp. DK]